MVVGTLVGLPQLLEFFEQFGISEQLKTKKALFTFGTTKRKLTFC